MQNSPKLIRFGTAANLPVAGCSLDIQLGDDLEEPLAGWRPSGRKKSQLKLFVKC